MVMVLLLGLLAGCVLLPDRSPSTPPASTAPSAPPAGPSISVPTALGGSESPGPQSPPSQVAIKIKGRTQVWNGVAYETVAEFSRDAELFMVTKPIGGGTAFAILSGPLFEEKAGAILFATNTAALRNIPDISRNLVDSAIDVAGLDVDEPATGRYAATVDPVMARAVTLFYFHIRNGSNYPPKQILAGTVSLQRSGEVITGEIALEGADFVGGARPVNRYLATLSSR